MGNVRKEKSASSTFEESLGKLEELLGRLEDPSLPLGELVQCYEDARKHIQECRRLLDEAELKVKLLSKEGKETDFSAES